MITIHCLDITTQIYPFIAAKYGLVNGSLIRSHERIYNVLRDNLAYKNADRIASPLIKEM